MCPPRRGPTRSISIPLLPWQPPAQRCGAALTGLPESLWRRRLTLRRAEQCRVTGMELRHRAAGSRPYLSGRQRAGDCNEGAYAGPSATRCDIAVRLAVQEGGSGNVEMCPRSACCHELPKEGGGHQSTSPAVMPGGTQVGDLRIQLVADLLRDGKLPDLLTSRLGSIENQVCGRAVGGHQTSRAVAEGDHARACQRRDIDHQVGLILVRP